jgi:perosamine synthetase
MSKRQITFARPIMGEEEQQAVSAVMATGMLVHGPKIVEFEEAFRAFTGAPHAVGVASCTAALHLSYFHLGIGPGDEVIVPAQTHTATAHAVELTGARPVFVDAEPDSGNIDVSQIERALTPRTRALSVVHFLGMPADMTAIMDIAGRRGLFVVEDCALAMGTTIDGVHAGLHGDVGCFSFYPAKQMTTAEGGLLITRHEDIAHAIRRKRAFGMDRHVGERKIPGVYDVQGLGFNYRMSEIHAAIGIEQVKRLPGFLERRAHNFRRLARGLARVEGVRVLDAVREGCRNSHYCLSILLADRFVERRPAIIAALNERGIGTSIYYPHPVPEMTYYREKYGYRPGAYPVAARISDTSIALPVGPHVTDADADYIVAGVEEVLRGPG